MVTWLNRERKEVRFVDFLDTLSGRYLYAGQTGISMGMGEVLVAHPWLNLPRPRSFDRGSFFSLGSLIM